MTPLNSIQTFFTCMYSLIASTPFSRPYPAHTRRLAGHHYHHPWFEPFDVSGKSHC
jgi:hypothetical protein